MGGVPSDGAPPPRAASPITHMPRTGGQQRREEILAQAVRLFGARGYEGTSLDAVAEATGIRKQSLLYHFPAKEDLFDACLAVVSARIVERLNHALDGPEDGWDRVEQVIRSLFRLAEEWPEFPGFVREASRRGADVVHRFAGTLDPLRKRAIEFLEKGMQDGVFRRQEPSLLLFMIYTAVVGSITEAGVLRAVAGGGGAVLRAREKELLDFVRAALAPVP